MKKVPVKRVDDDLQDDLQPEYDLTKLKGGVRGNYYKQATAALKYLRERGHRGSRRRFEQVLARVPDVEPEESDRLPQEALKPTARPGAARAARGQRKQHKERRGEVIG